MEVNCFSSQVKAKGCLLDSSTGTLKNACNKSITVENLLLGEWMLVKYEG